MNTHKTDMFNAVCEFFQGDKDKARAWFHTRNFNLGGLTPSEMIKQGKTQRVSKFIFENLQQNIQFHGYINGVDMSNVIEFKDFKNDYLKVMGLYTMLLIDEVHFIRDCKKTDERILNKLLKTLKTFDSEDGTQHHTAALRILRQHVREFNG